jgi:hypothetical protein
MVIRVEKLACFGVVFGIAAVTLSSCSAQTFLGKSPFSGKDNSSKTPVQGTVQNNPAPDPGTIEEELPTIDVAGSNLVGDCRLLSVAGIVPDTLSAECTVSGFAEETKVVMSNPVIEMDGQANSLAANGTSAKFSVDEPNVVLAGPKNPISFHFDVPNAVAPTMTQTTTWLSFESIELKDKTKPAPWQLKLNVEKYNQNIACATGTVQTQLFHMETRADSVQGPGFVAPQNELQLATLTLYPKEVFSASASSAINNGKMVICDANFKNNLEVTWQSAFPTSIANSLMQVVTLGNALLYNSMSPSLSTLYKHDNTAAAKILDRVKMEEAIANSPAVSLSKKEWCAFRNVGCFALPAGTTTGTTTTTNKLIFDFDQTGFSSEALVPVAEEMILAKQAPFEFKVWFYNKATPALGDPHALATWITTTNTNFEFIVKYVILP